MKAVNFLLPKLSCACAGWLQSSQGSGAEGAGHYGTKAKRSLTGGEKSICAGEKKRLVLINRSSP